MLWTNEDYRKQLSEEHLKEKWYAEAGSKEEFSIYGEKIIAHGLLKFNQETACVWGGPFPGGFCVFYILDTLTRTQFKPYSMEDLFQIGFNSYERIELKYYPERACKIPSEAFPVEREIYKQKWLDEEVVPGLSQKEYLIMESGCIEYPIQFYCYGTDDASYTAHFESKEKALEILELLSSLDELDFYKDFLPFGFVFTN